MCATVALAPELGEVPLRLRRSVLAATAATACHVALCCSVSLRAVLCRALLRVL